MKRLVGQNDVVGWHSGSLFGIGFFGFRRSCRRHADDDSIVRRHLAFVDFFFDDGLNDGNLVERDELGEVFGM